MSFIDPLIVLVYLIVMLVIGIMCARQSGSGIRSYFLGGNKTPWWVLAASGSASNYDVAGTMFIVSVFYTMGMKSIWLWWSWQFFASAFLAAYMALWVYRTGAMTAIELLHIRFGDGHGGKFARTAGAVLMVTFMIFSLGYGFIGISKFLPSILPEQFLGFTNSIAGMFVELPEAGMSAVVYGKVWAIILMLLTMVYVTAGGFKGVVITDMIQAVLMAIAGVTVSVVVFLKLDANAVALIKDNFLLSPLPVASLGKPDWPWNELGKYLPFFIAMGFLIHMNGAGGHYQEQRFLAARSERDAAKVGLGWGLFLIPRWMLIAGITFVAIAGLVDVQDPEQILPAVIGQMLPVGIKGLVLAGLAAAFMSTLSSTLNAASGMIVRDIVQPAMPKLDEKKLVRIGYISTVAILFVGLLVGWQAKSISGIWTWMMAGLIGGMLIPNIMRWHWWRLNGVGYAAGLMSALLVAAITGLVCKQPEYITAPIIWGASLIGAVAGSLLTKPTEMDDLVRFYSRVRPFGFWGPVKAEAKKNNLEPLVGPARSPLLILLNVVLFMCLLVGCYHGAFLMVGHFILPASGWLGLAFGAGIALYFTWYKAMMKLSDICVFQDQADG